MIDTTMSVNEVIRRYPVSVTVFNEFGVDACCGGAASLADAAAEARADLGAMMNALNELSALGVQAPAS